MESRKLLEVREVHKEAGKSVVECEWNIFSDDELYKVFYSLLSSIYEEDKLNEVFIQCLERFCIDDVDDLDFQPLNS